MVVSFKKYVFASVVFCSTLLCAMSCFADGASRYDNNLTGNWHGKRARWFDQGVDITLNYTWDAMRVTKGGKKHGGRALDDTDLILTMDGEKLWNIPGSSGRIYMLGNSFGKPNAALAGTIQGIDNIEVAQGSGKLFEAWLQQNFWNNKVSLLAGLYNVNGEFYSNNASALLMHPTFGIGSELALTGLNGPSSFPTTALGARLKIQPTTHFYAMAAATDGVAGNPQKLRGTHVHLRHKDGAFLIAETGYIPQSTSAIPTGKYAVGAWQYTTGFADFMHPSQKRHNKGIYAILEQQLYASDGALPTSLTGFMRVGVTKGNVSPLKNALSAGITYQGFSSKRPSAILGIGIQQAQSTTGFYQAALQNGVSATKAERGVELTYQDQIVPGILIQPDLQYIVRPGMNKQQENATILGLRLKLIL